LRKALTSEKRLKRLRVKKIAARNNMRMEVTAMVGSFFWSV